MLAEGVNFVQFEGNYAEWRSVEAYVHTFRAGFFGAVEDLADFFVFDGFVEGFVACLRNQQESFCTCGGLVTLLEAFSVMHHFGSAESDIIEEE